MELRGPDGAPPRAGTFEVFGFSGGRGFDGCSLNPQGLGTAGGNGGELFPNGAGLPTLINAGPIMTLRGGDGGNGLGVGSPGGLGGTVDGTPAPERDGAPGGVCEFTPTTLQGEGFIAVELQSNLVDGDGNELPFGAIVPLCGSTTKTPRRPTRAATRITSTPGKAPRESS